MTFTTTKIWIFSLT